MCVRVYIPERWRGKHSCYRKETERRDPDDFSVSWLDLNSDFCNDEPAVRADEFSHKKNPRGIYF